MASSKPTRNLRVLRCYPLDLALEFQVYVEGIPPDVGKFQLARLFSVYGNPFASFVFKAPVNSALENSSWGFIAFTDELSARKALRNDDPEIKKLGMTVRRRTYGREHRAMGITGNMWKTPDAILAEEKARRDVKRMEHAAANPPPRMAFLNGVLYVPARVPGSPYPGCDVFSNSGSLGGGGDGAFLADDYGFHDRGFYGHREMRPSSASRSEFVVDASGDGKIGGTGKKVGGKGGKDAVPTESAAPGVNPAADYGNVAHDSSPTSFDVQLAVGVQLHVESTGAGRPVVTVGRAVVLEDVDLGGVDLKCRPGRDFVLSQTVFESGESRGQISLGPCYAVTPNTACDFEEKCGAASAYSPKSTGFGAPTDLFSPGRGDLFGCGFDAGDLPLFVERTRPSTQWAFKEDGAGNRERSRLSTTQPVEKRGAASGCNPKSTGYGASTDLDSPGRGGRIAGGCDAGSFVGTRPSKRWFFKEDGAGKRERSRCRPSQPVPKVGDNLPVKIVPVVATEGKLKRGGGETSVGAVGGPVAGGGGLPAAGQGFYQKAAVVKDENPGMNEFDQRVEDTTEREPPMRSELREVIELLSLVVSDDEAVAVAPGCGQRVETLAEPTLQEEHGMAAGDAAPDGGQGGGNRRGPGF